MSITKNSKWKRSNGQTLEVVGIWAVGCGDSYRPVSYELKNSTGDINIVEAGLFQSQVFENKLIRV